MARRLLISCYDPTGELMCSVNAAKIDAAGNSTYLFNCYLKQQFDGGSLERFIGDQMVFDRLVSSGYDSDLQLFTLYYENGYFMEVRRINA